MSQNDEVKARVEAWLNSNDKKLRQYAQSLASRNPNNIHDADDLFQIMGMKIYMQARLSPAFMDQTDGYLLKTAWNEALTALRAQRRYELRITSMPDTDDSDDKPSMDNFADSDQGPDAALDTEADSQMIALAINSLPLNSQRVCRMLYAGYKPVEIARKMGVGRNNISYHIGRIRKTLMEFGLQAS